MSLQLVPVSFVEAATFVAEHHRHNKAPPSHKFSIGIADDVGELVGVVIVGRPIARAFDDGDTLEVTRTAVRDGVPNANSMLYGAAWRAAKALDYRRLVTYTQGGETGSSLRAAGWRTVAERPARSGWSTPSRLRNNTTYISGQRTLWEAHP